MLIRAVTPNEGLDVIRARRGGVRDRDLTNGPGKLGQAFAITRECDGLRPGPDAVLQLLQGAHTPARRDILVTPRIGISRAVDWPLRFVLRPESLLATAEGVRNRRTKK